MRLLLIASLWLLGFSIARADSLRVGNRLLVAGDSAAQVRELLGRPPRITHQHAARRHRGVMVTTPASERWIYRRNGGQLTVTLVEGEVVAIEQRP